MNYGNGWCPRVEKEVVVRNKTGLHARPGGLFCQESKKYESEIQIEKGDRRANAKSIINILSLGITQGSKIKIIARGPDEKEAVEALASLIESKFGEE
jgi:phosphocarrier protein HPr